MSGMHGETLTRFFDTPEFKAPDRGGVRLFGIAGAHSGANFALPEGTAVLGRRPDNAIVLTEPGVSKTHCTFAREGAVTCVTDAGSRNGTEVNGRMLEPNQRLELAHGDTVRICSTVLLFVDPGEQQEQATIDVDASRAKQEAKAAVDSVKALIERVKHGRSES